MTALNLSKSQLTILCAVEGSCVAGIPAAVYFNRAKEMDPIQNLETKSDVSNQQRERVHALPQQVSEEVNIKESQVKTYLSEGKNELQKTKN